MTGKWDFNDLASPLQASVGSDAIAYKHVAEAESGLGGLSVVTDSSILASAKGGALAIPKTKFLAVPHGVTDGTKWCFKMRFYVPSVSCWHALYSLNMANDGDAWLGINKSTGAFGNTGTGGIEYKATTLGTGIFGRWNTLVLTVDSTSAVTLYVNGEKLGTSSKYSNYDLTGKNYIYIGADNNGEQNLFYIDSVEVYDETKPAEVFDASKFTDHAPTGPQAYRYLPDGYTQVGSLTSSAAQYIDTGLIPSTDTAVDLNFGDIVYKDSTAFFGQSWTGDRYLFNMQNSKFLFHGSGTTLDTSVLAETDYRCQVDTNGVLYLAHESTVNNYSVSLNSDASTHLFLFGRSGGNPAAFTLYGFKVWKNDILLRDFVPALRDSDAKPGLFDLVENRFYVNTASGDDFTYGEETKIPKTNPTFASTGGAVYVVPGTDAEYYYWSVTNTVGTLTIPEGGATVDLLLVAGGGAGGLCRGGGGGGGGVVYRIGQNLAAGTYSITVGAGGVPQAKPTSGEIYKAPKTPDTATGGNSSVKLGDTELFVAHGGGGGGNFVYQSGDDANDSKGLAGGSGGGAGGHNEIAISGGAGIDGEGYAGGSQPANYTGGAGGGGAGASGGYTTSGQCGAGGAGRAIGITGRNVTYGGGGGGGGFTIPGGEGGAGGGAAGNYDVAAWAESGKDGLGGGGGGGGGYGNKAEYAGGGYGGSGVVIIRYAPPTAEPTISTFEVESTEYDRATFGIGVSSLGIGATSASVRLEVAADAGFADILVTSNETLTAGWQTEAYVVEIAPTTEARYARLIVDNGSLASTSEVVYVELEHSFLLSGTGYEFGAGGLELSALLDAVAAPSVTVSLYVNGAVTPTETKVVSAAGPVDFTLPGVSVQTDVRMVITAVGKTEEQTFTATPGTVRKVVADPAAHVTGPTAVVLGVGDSVVFPTGEWTYESVNTERLLSATAANAFTALDAGIASIKRLDPNGVILFEIVLVIEPADKPADARTFIYNVANNKGWANINSWTQVGVDENDAYPNAATDLAYIPVTGSSDVTVAIEGTNTVMDLYIGRPDTEARTFRLQGAAAAGSALKIVGNRTVGEERPGTLMFCSSTENESVFEFRLGGSDANRYLALIADNDINVDFGGPKGTVYGETSKHCYTKFYCSNAHADIAEGTTFQLINGQNHPTGVDQQGGWYEFCADFMRGSGTCRVAMPGVFTLWSNYLRLFKGRFVDSVRNNITQASSNRGGNIYSTDYNSPDSTLRLEGFVSRDFSIRYSLGTFIQGSAHGYGGAGSMPYNGLPDAGVELAGGLMEFITWNKGKANFWLREDGDYEAHNFTDQLTVDAGLSYLWNGSGPKADETGLPINHFCASNVIHKNDGTLYVADRHTVDNSTAARCLTELHGLSNFAVGYTGAEDSANDVFPIVPWCVTRIENNDWKLWWAHVDADGVMCRGGSHVNTALASVTDPNRNVYSWDNSAALSADVTVNSLVLGNVNKEKRLGEGRTLTVTSGGLVLANTGSAIGTAAGGTANGSLVFPNRAYVYATSSSDSNPNQLWTPITAPQGFVGAFAGYLVLGGDQTGIDTDIVLNNGTTYLGAKDGSGEISIDVPVTLVGGNTRLYLSRAGVLGSLDLKLKTAGDYSPKIEIAEGVAETCNKVYVDGVTLAHGTYGATGSGAEFIDDEHFAGAGTLTILYDELGTPIFSTFASTLVEELSAEFTVDVTKGTGATECRLYSLATKVSDGTVLTNLFRTITEDAEDLAFVVSNLEDGVTYDVRVWAHNTKEMSGETTHFEALSDPVRITTVAIDYTPTMTVDEANIVPTASTATIPWNLVNKGYLCELVSLKLVYGESADALDREKTLDPAVDCGANVSMLEGLLGGHTYYAKFVAVNNKGDGWQGESAVFHFTTISPAVVTGDGNALVNLGGDYVATFAGAGTIAIPEATTARVLLVGGGGAGGRWQGGGGGGGQVVEIAELVLAPGQYTVNVGAGGIPTDDSEKRYDYSKGGTSSIVQGETVLAEAVGGGSGGNYSNTQSNRDGGDGANGGGASDGADSRSGAGGEATAKGGHAGGSTPAAGEVAAGGGGGAGEDGEDGAYFAATSTTMEYALSGKGGDGVASDITGATVWYGGGGGGGVYSRDAGYATADSTFRGTPGDGGKGGGGNGGGGNFAYGTYRWATAGTDGLGGGGGGGARYNSKSDYNTNHWGTVGGKGTVIIRFANTEREPVVAAKVTRSDLDRATVAVTLGYAGAGKSAADLFFACGTDAAALEPQCVQSGLAQGATYEHSFAKPTAGTTYYYKAYATNAWGRASAVVEGSFAIAAVPSAGTGGTIERQGDYIVQTFSADGTLTLPSAVEADILVLAGGGAGGYERAGGGGAGGLIYRRGVKLAAGEYAVTVGAGGTPTTANKAGGNGGDSVLALGEAELFRAIGGGGGGNFNQNDWTAYGANGGSGGGNARRAITPSSGVEGQGFPGGIGTPYEGNLGGGGGGAGACGHNPVYYSTGYIKRGGAGGEGRELDISGAFVWYAGGGGGSVYAHTTDGGWWYSEGGEGGKGGGGKGAGGNGKYGSAYVPNVAGAGTDGLGGGGGGGSAAGNTGAATVGGGKGGSGIVVVRYYAPETGAVGAAPVIELREAKGEENATVTVGWKILSVGTDASACTVTARYGLSADALTKTQVLATNASGEGQATLKGVKPGECWYIRLEATNDREVAGTAGSLAKVKVPKLVEYTTTRLGGDIGVLQAQFDGQRNWSDDIIASDTLRRELRPAMGQIYGTPYKNGTWQYTSPIDGIVTSWDSYRTFAYRGYIYLKAGQSIRFVSNPDDFALIKVDGETLVDTRQSCYAELAYYTSAKTGYHPIELRIGNGVDAAGRTTSSDLNSHNFKYMSCVPGSQNRAWAFYELESESTFQLLRTGPAGRGFDATFVSDLDGIFKATLATSAADASSDELYACYGETAAGDDRTAWDHCEKLATLGTDAAEIAFAKELTDAQAFVRFCTVDGDGNVAWSKTFVRDVFAAPRIGETHIAENTGDTLVFAGSLEEPGNTNAVLTLHYGTDRNDTSDYVALTTNPDEDGTFSVTVSGLPNNTRYYYYWTVDGAVADTTASETVVTAGATTWTYWYDTRNQRLLQVNVEIGAIGAGNQAEVKLEVQKYDNKGFLTSKVQAVDAMTVTAPGHYVLSWDASQTAAFGECYQYRVVVKNGSGTSSFSAEKSDTIIFEDRLTYTWTGGGATGAWNDPANWSKSSATTDTLGYPSFLADVVFPAGCDAEVLLTEDDLAINSLTFATGSSGAETRVTLKGDRRLRVWKRKYGSFTMNGYLSFGDWANVTLDGVKVIAGDVGSIELGAHDTLTFANGAALSVINHFYARKEGTTVTVGPRSTLAAHGDIRIGGAGTRLVIDDGDVSIYHPEYRFYANDNNAEDVQIVFKGKNPLLSMARLNTGNNGKGVTFDFVVPLGGYAVSPIRKFRNSKQTNQLPCDVGSQANIVMTIDPDSPALADNRTVAMPVFDCLDGFVAAEFTLSEATGVEWAWSDYCSAGKDTRLGVTVTGQGAEALSPAAVQTPAAKVYGPYTIYSYTDTTKPGVFTAAADTTVDLLLVGGGGAGGWGLSEDKEYGSAGGGAGGFKYVTDLAVGAGSYLIDVGRGGDARPWDLDNRPAGRNGRDTVAFGYRVYGGGGGAAISRAGSAEYGQHGGSGGGAANGSGNYGKALVSGEGNNGGSGNGNNYGGGGGGAGAVGMNGNSTNAHGTPSANGDGGAGLTCDITGETRKYAGGGGAGATTRSAIGGSGSFGGGNGGDRQYNSTGADGVDGTGGGGGGGAYSQYQNIYTYTLDGNYGQCPGGSGGDGIVIVRVRTEASTSVPYVAIRSVTPANDGATVEWEYLEAGDGATATGTAFRFVCTDTESGIAYTNDVAAGAAYGVQSTTLGGLKPGAEYSATLVATNDQAEKSPADRAAFTFTASAETPAAADAAGLIQGSSASQRDLTFDIASAADARRELGAVMVDRRGDYVSPLDGEVSYWAKKKTYGYTGYMYMKGGQSYSFAGMFTYISYLKVDGKVIFSLDQESPAYYSNAYTPEQDGWYAVEIRAGARDSTWWGPYRMFEYGIAWTTNANHSTSASWEAMTFDGWEKFLDPGDGSLLRTSIPKSRALSITGALWDGERTTLTATAHAETDGTHALEIVACYAETYGGEDLAAWTTVVAGTNAVEVADLTVALAGVPRTGYLRFFGYYLDAEGARTGETVWSDSLFLTECDEHELEVPSVALGALEPGMTDVTVPVTVLSTGSEDDKCTVVIEYGRTSELGQTVSFADLAVGTHRLSIPGLMPLETYFVRVYATNAAGTSEKTATSETSTSKLVEDSSTGSTPGLYQAKFNDNYSKTKTLDDSVIPVETTLGPVMADIQVDDSTALTTGYTNPKTGTTYYWNQQNTTFLYSGYMLVIAGQTYTFGKYLDDSAYIKLDGKVLIDNQTHSSWVTATYTATATTYVPIEIRIGDGTGGKGPKGTIGGKTLGLAYNLTGKTDRDDSSWMKLLDPDDGSLFATTAATRKPTVTQYSVDTDAATDQLTATITFGEIAAADGLDLYIAYGSTYGGVEEAKWDHVVKVGAFDIADTGTTYKGLSGLGTDVRYARFFFRNETVTTWSQCLLLDLFGIPQLDADSIAAANEWKGDTLNVCGSLLYEPQDGVTVKAQVSRTGDFTDAQDWTMASDGNGGYAVTIHEADTASARYIVPGSTVKVRIVATGSEGSDTSDPIEVTTAAGAVWSSSVPTLSSVHNTITAKAKLSSIGAHLEGEGAYVMAYAGMTPTALNKVGAVKAVSEAGEVSISFDVDTIGSAWYVALECSNACATASWVTRTGYASVTPTDAATYTWTGAGATGAWSDPDNWSTSSAIANGYPHTSGATAVFGDNTTGTVLIDGVYAISTLKLSGNNANVTFTSLNQDLKNGSVTAVGVGGSKDSVWTLDGASFAFTTDNWGWGGNGKNQATGNRIVVKGGALWNNHGHFYYDGDGNVLEVKDGSTMKSGNDGKDFLFGGNDIRVIVDDSTFTPRQVLYFNNLYACTGAKLVVKGENPLVKPRNTLRAVKAGGATLSFCVPKGGYAEAPVQPYATGSGELENLFNGSDASSKWTIEIDSGAPAFKRTKPTTTELINWRNTKSKTILTNLVEFASAPRGTTVNWIWTYGTDGSETPNGSNPTGLKATITGRGGFNIFLR